MTTIELTVVFLLSFTATYILYIPFIKLLRKFWFYKKRENVTKNVSNSTNIKTLVKDVPIKNPAFYKFYESKLEIPSSGGILFVLVTELFLLLYQLIYGLNTVYTLIMFSLLTFTSLGFYDDFTKFKKKTSKSALWGIRGRYKLLLQFILAIIIGCLLYQSDYNSINLFIVKLNLGIFYISWVALVIVATINSVNITDGLDGLATSLAIQILTAIIFVIYLLNNRMVLLPGFVFLSTLLAFWFYNKSPAKVYMGDSGSFAIGLFLSLLALLLHVEILLILLSVIFIVETLSVIIQITTSRLFNKKFFIITPLHIHLLNKGKSEKEIVNKFLLINATTVLVSLIAVFMIYE